MKKFCKSVLLLIVLNLSTNLIADGTQPTGSGTELDPYLVATLDNLLWISTNSTEWTKHYKQTMNIDATATSGWNSGAGFSPIGINYNQFTGSYNGQDYTIDGLYINRASSYIGMFGYTNGAEIDNIGVTNVDFTGGSYIGGLVGENNGSAVNNSYVSGSVTGDYHIGGLVGYNNSSSTVSNSYSTGSVTGLDNAGGLVGYNRSSSTVSNSNSTSSVNGNHNVGGLVGNNESSAVDNSYVNGSVNAKNQVGGLVGYNNSSSTVSNS